VDFAEPGGMNTASRLISPPATRSRRSINSLWCAAGSYPQCRHHSVRLLRMRRRRSSISAAVEGETLGEVITWGAVRITTSNLSFARPCPSGHLWLR
jgi:hypothetical protein